MTPAVPRQLIILASGLHRILETCSLWTGKGWRFAKRKGQIAFNLFTAALLLYTAWINFQIYKTGGRFQEVVERNLDAAIESLMNFDSNVNGLSLAVQEQKDIIAATLDSLSCAVNGLLENLEIYESCLQRIVAVTDSQIGLMAKTQEEWRIQLERHPRLQLRATDAEIQGGDTLSFQFEVYNLGNELARISGIELTVPPTCSLTTDKWRYSYAGTGSVKYCQFYSSARIVPFSPVDTVFVQQHWLDWAVKVCAPSELELPRIIPYSIFEEKTGIQTGLLVIEF